MDISKLRNDPVVDTKVREKARSEKAGKANQKPAEELTAIRKDPKGAERVRLSEDLKMAQEGLDIAKASPDVRAQKVAELKAAIKNGTYKVDNKELAEKMIRSALEDDVLTRMD